MVYTYFRRASLDFSMVLESILEHANHNKRIPANVLDFIVRHLDDPTYPLLVSAKVPYVYRGDVTTLSRFTQDIGKQVQPDSGYAKVILVLEPGSSWSTDIEQANYHATSGHSGGVEVVYNASTSKGTWLDMRELYKLSQLKGLRTEREVIGLSSRINCEAKWKVV